MIQKFKAAKFWAKMGYVSLAIAVLLGIGDVGDKVWAQIVKADSRYAKQVDLDQTNKNLFAMQQKLDQNEYLQLQQQLFEMKMRYGADMTKWTDAQRALYFIKKAELEKVRQKLKGNKK
jgi:hypothetical protein